MKAILLTVGITVGLIAALSIEYKLAVDACSTKYDANYCREQLSK